jgi:hypothetical protein
VKDFLLPFNLEACDCLDRFALLTCQSYNLGNNGDWFGCFRDGLYGLYARIHGVRVHFYEVHAWRLKIRTPAETEYHVSSIFFNMDSAVECFVFGINGLGNAVAPQEFLDATDYKALRRVAPWNILGNKGQSPRVGYTHYFPSLQAYWQESRVLLDTITEQHDVSKHRSTIYEGGRARDDPPPGFYEALGIENEPNAQVHFWPMAQIILSPEPKTPLSKRKPVAQGDVKKLEIVAETFCKFINTSCLKAFDDARSHIILPHPEFLK